MPYLQDMKGEIEKLRTELKAVLDKYPNMDAEDVKRARELDAELNAKQAAYEDLQQVEALQRQFAATPDGQEPPAAGDGQPVKNSEPWSVAKMLRESKAYQQFQQARAGTAVMEIPAAEAKALLTLGNIAPQANRQPGILTSAQDETTVADLVLPGTATTGAPLSYFEETTFTNAAAETAEGTAKPEAALGFTERTDPFRKIAVWIPATTEVLADNAQLQSYIEGRLRFMVNRRLEAEVLNGNGAAPNLLGITNRTGLQTQAKGTDPTPDAFYKAMTLLRVNAQAEPTAHVIHPTDWQDVKLLRTADGIYIWGSPADTGPDRLWGLPVRVTPMQTLNTGLTGAFRPFAQLFQIGGITVTVSTEHSTFFVENKVAILAEIRAALAVYRPAAFATVTGI